MRKILSIILGLYTFVSIQGQGIDFLENPEWQKVLNIAQEQKKQIFVDCYTQWCGPCQGLNKRIFPKKEMGDFYNQHFINVKYDMEKPMGIDFRKHYKGEIKAYPTLLFINPNNREIIHKIVGSKPMVEVFIEEAKKSLFGGSLSDLQRRYDNGERQYEFMKSYLEAIEFSGKKEMMLQMMDDYLHQYDTLANLMNADKWQFYGSYVRDLKLRMVQYLIENIYRFEHLEFVDKYKLNKDLQKCLIIELRKLINIEKNEESTHYSFRIDDENYQLVKKNLNQLKRQEGIEEPFSMLTIYENLSQKNWQKAYYTIHSVCDFNFRYGAGYRPAALCYIVQECADNQLKQMIYKDLISLQQKGEKWMQFFNLHNYIAFVAESLGQHEEAVKALTNYNELEAQKEAMLSKAKTKR